MDTTRARPDLAVSSVVYVADTVEELLADLADTGVDAVELSHCHLDPAEDPDPEALAAVREAFAEAGVDLVGFGVHRFEDPGEVRPVLAFADDLGVEYVTASFHPESAEIARELAAVGEDLGLDVFVHNTSTVHNDDVSHVFSDPEEVRAVLDEVDSPRLGAALDTAHYLVMGHEVDEAFETLGSDVGVVHVKDTSEEEIEDAPGRGKLDLDAVAAGLVAADVRYPPVIEFELRPADVSEGVRDAERAVRTALDDR